MALPEFRKWNPWRVAAGATVVLTLYSSAMWLAGSALGVPYLPRAVFNFGFIAGFILGPLLFLFGIVAVWVNWRWGLWAFVQVAVLVVALIYGYALALERDELRRMHKNSAAERAASAPP